MGFLNYLMDFLDSSVQLCREESLNESKKLTTNNVMYIHPGYSFHHSSRFFHIKLIVMKPQSVVSLRGVVMFWSQNEENAQFQSCFDMCLGTGTRHLKVFQLKLFRVCGLGGRVPSGTWNVSIVCNGKVFWEQLEAELRRFALNPSYEHVRST